MTEETQERELCLKTDYNDSSVCLGAHIRWITWINKCSKQGHEPWLHQPNTRVFQTDGKWKYWFYFQFLHWRKGAGRGSLRKLRAVITVFCRFITDVQTVHDSSFDHFHCANILLTSHSGAILMNALSCGLLVRWSISGTPGFSTAPLPLCWQGLITFSTSVSYRMTRWSVCVWLKRWSSLMQTG